LPDLQTHELSADLKSRHCALRTLRNGSILITGQGKVPILLRWRHRLLLALNFRRVNTDGGEMIVELLESRKHDLAIGGEVRIVDDPAYRLGPGPFALASSGLLVVVRAHSHSESQFLPHLPPHWKSIMCPPHCGQTRLMIEEIMFAFGSPGVVSIRLIVPPS
jgi:hypothetical protein